MKLIMNNSKLVFATKTQSNPLVGFLSTDFDSFVSKVQSSQIHLYMPMGNIGGEFDGVTKKVVGIEVIGEFYEPGAISGVNLNVQVYKVNKTATDFSSKTLIQEFSTLGLPRGVKTKQKFFFDTPITLGANECLVVGGFSLYFGIVKNGYSMFWTTNSGTSVTKTDNKVSALDYLVVE